MTLKDLVKTPKMEAFCNLLDYARAFCSQVLKGPLSLVSPATAGPSWSVTGRREGPAFCTIGEARCDFQAGGEASEMILPALPPDR
jgi:hypothetical protein